MTTLRLASQVTTGDRLTLEADAVGEPTGSLRPARAAGLGAALHLYRVNPGRAGGVGERGDQPAATAGDDSPHPSQRLLPALRRPRPDPVRPCCTPPGLSQKHPPTRGRLRDDATGGAARRRSPCRGRETARRCGSARPTYASGRRRPAGALKAHRLLVRARPARTVVCPGCEADCVMPVQTIPAGLREAARFIVW